MFPPLNPTGGITVAERVSEEYRKEKRVIWKDKQCYSHLGFLDDVLTKHLSCIQSKPEDERNCKKIIDKVNSLLDGFMSKTAPKQEPTGPPPKYGMSKSAKSVWRGVKYLKAHAFGSTEMIVSMTNGDLDMSIEGVLPAQSEARKALLRDIHGAIQRDNAFTACQLVIGARVPVSKFVHRASQTQCDLSIGNSTAVLKSKLLGQVGYK